MIPNFKNGEFILVKTSNSQIFKKGDVVVAYVKDFDKFVVKRIQSIGSVRNEFSYFLIGDNRDDSIDSRHFGSVTKAELKGKLLWKLTTDID